MKNNKFFLAVIVGTVVSFLLGWVIYGILLKTAMMENCGVAKDVAEKVFKPMDNAKPDFGMLGIIFVSNLCGALLLTIVAGWANARSLGAGIKVGAIFGLLITLNFDLLWYSMSNLYTPTGLGIDVAAGTVMTAITTAVIAMVLGKGKTS
jgi:Protein of unknown function (DUF1761)